MNDYSRPGRKLVTRVPAKRHFLLETRLVGLITCLLFASFPSHAIHPGAYVCAVDNCKKQYRAEGEQLFEACREGAAYAADSEPASQVCMTMCKTNYGGDSPGAHKACETGCALYPSRCLRFGKLPPKDDYARDKFRDYDW